jgi:pyruvate dehydrogenase E2 component (dihydrolipoamide acetyltransferase)
VQATDCAAFDRLTLDTVVTETFVMKRLAQDAPFLQWRVQPRSERGMGPWSDTAYVTLRGAEQIKLLPRSPKFGARGVPTSGALTVGNVVNTTKLAAELGTDPYFDEGAIVVDFQDSMGLYVGLAAGESVKVDEIIAIIGEAGTDYTPLLTSEEAPKEKSIPESSKETVKSAAPVSVLQSSTPTPSEGRVKASPLAKQLAKEKGIDISSISGSGENGRIIKKDVESARSGATASESKSIQSSVVSSKSTSFGQESFEDVPLSQMRKTIARRLSESLYTAPHFYLTMEINMDKAIEARKSIIDFTGNKISFNDMVIKAVASSLKQNPKVNASWLGDKIRYNNHIHIGS